MDARKPWTWLVLHLPGPHVPLPLRPPIALRIGVAPHRVVGALRLVGFTSIHGLLVDDLSPERLTGIGVLLLVDRRRPRCATEDDGCGQQGQSQCAIHGSSPLLFLSNPRKCVRKCVVAKRCSAKSCGRFSRRITFS